MEFDTDKFKDLIRWMLDNFEKLETELTTLRAAFLALQAFDSSVGEALELALQTARLSPPIADVKIRYDRLRESFAQQVDEAALAQDLSKFLQEWKPKGQPN
jgi:hypothetical protein